MDNPQLYDKVNRMQKEDSKEFLERYVHLIKWNRNGNDWVIDIGCGSGNVTYDVLKSTIPQNVGRILAVDVSKSMIDQASVVYKHDKIEYDVVDFSKPIPMGMHGKFDHAFSFFCMHWIHNQQVLMKNICDLLKPGGDLLFLMLHECEQVDANLEILAENPRWQKYMTDVTNYILPYRKCNRPKDALTDLLETTGFKIGMCEIVQKTYTLPDDAELTRFLESFSPFVGRIPKEEQTDFMREYVELFKKNDPTKVDEHTTKYYSLFYVYAVKNETEVY